MTLALCALHVLTPHISAGTSLGGQGGLLLLGAHWAAQGQLEEGAPLPTQGRQQVLLHTWQRQPLHRGETGSAGSAKG